MKKKKTNQQKRSQEPAWFRELSDWYNALPADSIRAITYGSLPVSVQAHHVSGEGEEAAVAAALIGLSIKRFNLPYTVEEYENKSMEMIVCLGVNRVAELIGLGIADRPDGTISGFLSTWIAQKQS